MRTDKSFEIVEMEHSLKGWFPIRGGHFYVEVFEDGRVGSSPMSCLQADELGRLKQMLAALVKRWKAEKIKER